MIFFMLIPGSFRVVSVEFAYAPIYKHVGHAEVTVLASIKTVD
jgi:hypothetical protein